MSTAVTIPNTFGAVSTVFANETSVNDLAAGVQAGFGILGYRGKAWSTRYRGEEKTLMRPDGDGPRNSLEIVILKASSHVSKIFYENGFTEGSSAAPDCFSPNGITPDLQSKKKQHSNCAGCPRNQWGSRVTPAGKPGKQCSDSKRLAITPLDNIANEAFGGPMLLRTPAASLTELANFGDAMQGLGYAYYSIGIRVSFDPAESYPKFKFQAVRPLNDAEAVQVLAMRNSHAVERILAEGSEQAHQPAGQTPPPIDPSLVFEQPAPPNPNAGGAAAVMTVEPVSVAQSQQVSPQVAIKTVSVAVTSNQSDFEKSLDDQLNALLPD